MSESGAVQIKSIRVEPLALAWRPVGAPGTPPVVAESELEGSDVPAELIAETR